jgi:hypothetical protein
MEIPMKQFQLSCLFQILWAIAATAQVNPAPLVNQPLVPAAVAPGHAAFTLTVNGTGFVPHSTIYWNGVKQATQVISSSRLKAEISAEDVAKAGTASVTVLNPHPGGGTSNAVFFPIREPASSVAISPTLAFSGAQATAVGDFNNDGKPDVAVGLQNKDGSGEIEIYLGKGDGTFGGPVNTETVTSVATLLTGDFNGDGKLDLAVGDDEGNVSIFLNQGGGRMQQSQVFDSQEPVLAADFNNDGKLDLIVLSYDEQSRQAILSICLGQGDGTFAPPQEIVSGVLSAAAGDFDGDGNLDLALPGVEIYLGNGDGTFRFGSECGAQYGGEYTAVADVNGDGNLDIITDGVSVLLGKGDGTCTANGGVQVDNYFYDNLVLGDLNGDGILDIALAYGTQDGLFSFDLLLGNGDGSFQTPLQFGVPGTPGPLGIGDFNGDGKLDLVDNSLYLSISASLTPNALAFGNQDVGTQSQPQTVTLTNVGSSDLVIQQIGVDGNDPNDFTQSNKCPGSLPPNQSCQIQVVFDPTQGGSRSAWLYVNYEGVGSPQTVALTGTGIDLTVSLTPSSMKFASRLVHTTSPPQTATLTNTGTQAVNISSISTAAPFAESNNCPTTLEPNTDCQIQVTFTPVNGGKARGTLDVYDNAGGSPQSVALSGSGTAVKLSPGSVNFGNQKVGTQSSPFPIKFSNEGATSISISKISFSGTDAGDFSQTNNCGKSVPGGKSCNIEITFAPKAKGHRSAKLDVYDNGGGSPQTATLAGTGT